MTYFADEFGFTDDQTVAIMGAHTYGGMDEDNSGYFFFNLCLADFIFIT